jgi:hypothetical protein
LTRRRVMLTIRGLDEINDHARRLGRWSAERRGR